VTRQKNLITDKGGRRELRTVQRFGSSSRGALQAERESMIAGPIKIGTMHQARGNVAAAATMMS